MDRLVFVKSLIFITLTLLGPSQGVFDIKTVGWSAKCNDHYGNMTTIPARPGFVEPLIFTTFQDFPNLYAEICFSFPTYKNDPIKYVVNICSLQSRRQNVIVRLFAENILSSIKNRQNIKCPFKKGVYEVAERKHEKLRTDVQKYLPKHILLDGKANITLTLFFKKQSQRIMICETIEVHTVRLQ